MKQHWSLDREITSFILSSEGSVAKFLISKKIRINMHVFRINGQ